MIMSPRLSKLLLTSHISFSVGWLGAVAVFLVLAITSLTTTDTKFATAALLGMDLSARYVILPFCFASLLTGILQAMGTRWGLLKHYWIAVKLLLTILSTVLLLLHMQPISYLAGLGSGSEELGKNIIGLKIQMIADAGAAILVLLIITSISVYKPWGRINRDIRFEPAKVSGKRFSLPKSPGFYIGIAILCIVLYVIIKHLVSGGMGGH